MKPNKLINKLGGGLTKLVHILTGNTLSTARIKLLLFVFSFSLLSWIPVPAEDENDVWFQIVVLPDSQYYISETNGGTLSMFQEQINWIKNNLVSEKIAYVAHVGDLVNTGSNATQWTRAKNLMYQLETPAPGFPDGIPYGIAIGNHDQQPTGQSRGTPLYNTHFGYSHFAGRSYYGGRYGTSDNNNHYDLFSAGGLDFIVIYVEYNNNENYYDPGYMTDVNNWVHNILTTHSNRKAIIVSHHIIGTGVGRWSNQGKILYDRIKDRSNVFLMLCGHVPGTGEGFRQDTYNCNTIKTYLSDYQGREEEDGQRRGGYGRMRLMKFNITKQTLSIKTFAPRADGNHFIEDDENSQFTKPLFGAD